MRSLMHTLPITAGGVFLAVTSMGAGRVVLKVPEERPEVYEQPAWPETVLDRLEVADEIGSRVEKENSGDSVKRVFAIRVAIQQKKVRRTHALSDERC